MNIFKKKNADVIDVEFVEENVTDVAEEEEMKEKKFDIKKAGKIAGGVILGAAALGFGLVKILGKNDSDGYSDVVNPSDDYADSEPAYDSSESGVGEE